MHGARAAQPLAAAELRTGELEPVAQHPQQPDVVGDGDGSGVGSASSVQAAVDSATAMAQAALTLARPDAARRLYDLVEEITR